MRAITILLKVAVQDVLILAGFLVIGCGISTVTEAVGSIVSNILLLVVLCVLFFFLFYSNAELFKGFRNVYAWSLSSGLLTLSLVIPAIMFLVHNPCRVPLVGQ
jgi:hypothetical protein